MINLIAIVLGASLAVLYVGFFAISIGETPLLVIVVAVPRPDGLLHLRGPEGRVAVRSLTTTGPGAIPSD